MTDSLIPTNRLVTETDRAIRNVRVNPQYRADLLDNRNKLRSRTADIVRRLENGDRWCEEHANEPKVVKGEDLWIALLGEYESAYDALERANAHL